VARAGGQAATNHNNFFKVSSEIDIDRR